LEVVGWVGRGRPPDSMATSGAR